MTRLQKCLTHNLQYYRKQRGYTQEQLAEKVNTSVNYMGLIERGKNIPSFQMIEKIAAALEIDPTQLFVPENKTDSIPLMKKTLLEKMQQVIESTFDENMIF